MSIQKAAIVGIASFFALSVTAASAAVGTSSISKPAVDVTIEHVKKAKKKKDQPGKCGVMMYYSKKTKKCTAA